jgi:hypothetical protein
MNLSDLSELQCIMPIANIRSVSRNGILSHSRVARLTAGGHTSVASSDIQQIRSGTRVPNARPLHEYVNLYFCARNPMMSLILYKGWATEQDLSVLRVDPAVLNLPGTVIADGNAASTYTAFRAAPAGLEYIDGKMTYATNWVHPDEIETWRHKSAMCAEVLVPDVVAPRFILGAWVVDATAKSAFDALSTSIPCDVNAHVFFK